MDIYVTVLRLVHIFSGIFWVGTAFFFALFFEPTIKAAGAEGGKVMGRLTLTKFPLAMTIASLLTVVAGVLLYLDASGGLQASWIFSLSGLALTIGGSAGILAFLLGLTVQGPSAARMSALQKGIQAAGAPPTSDQMQELQRLQERIAIASRWGAVLMVIAVLGMVMAH